MKQRPLLDVAYTTLEDLSRDEVYAAILCGEILVDGERIRDPRRPVRKNAGIELVRQQFVSRGGEKLHHALTAWNMSVAGKIFVDAGASTGGFTDCLLQHGATCIHAIDVGTNQLAYRIRSDPRVLAREQTNLMDVLSLQPRPHAGVADLSFRSLRHAAAHLLGLTSEGWAIVLVKPQFELGHRDDDFGGVVRDDQILREVLVEVLRDLWEEGVFTSEVLESPIRGRRGNREYLYLVRSDRRLSLEEAISIAESAI